MKHLLAIVFLLLTIKTFAQDREVLAVNAKVEELKSALLSGDSAQLTSLVMPGLSYGHSSGLIENRDEFIRKLASGRSDFVTLELSNQAGEF